MLYCLGSDNKKSVHVQPRCKFQNPLSSAVHCICRHRACGCEGIASCTCEQSFIRGEHRWRGTDVGACDVGCVCAAWTLHLRALRVPLSRLPSASAWHQRTTSFLWRPLHKSTQLKFYFQIIFFYKDVTLSWVLEGTWLLTGMYLADLNGVTETQSLSSVWTV